MIVNNFIVDFTLNSLVIERKARWKGLERMDYLSRARMMMMMIHYFQTPQSIPYRVSWWSSLVVAYVQGGSRRMFRDQYVKV